MNTLPGSDDFPLGVLPGDVSERDRRQDQDFWEALWDDAHRYEEENRRDEQ